MLLTISCQTTLWSVALVLLLLQAMVRQLTLHAPKWEVDSAERATDSEHKMCCTPCVLPALQHLFCVLQPELPLWSVAPLQQLCDQGMVSKVPLSDSADDSGIL